ncbi:MAG: amylosucrase [Xanthomonadaceae bacterium]|nr:amylosucrase [Xanthomonadaceae bacterium]
MTLNHADSPVAGPSRSAWIAAARGRFLQALPADREAEGSQRFDRAGEALVARLASLYGHRDGFADWLGALCQSLGALAAARPGDLAALDRARESRPDWFIEQRMLGYSAYVDRFGGTLAGVAGRIPHLAQLGVDYLHLLPFLRARSGDSDGGFAVASFDEVDPAYGSMADLDALTARLREAGISLCSDLVLNHVADDHAWARAAMAGDADRRAFFHVLTDRAQVEAYEATLGQVFPQAAPGNFTHVPAMGGWVWTTFYPFQWDLDYAHPPVFAEMAQAMLRLANHGVEVFRLDSAPFLWKRPGTDCLNQPEVHVVLAALRACAALVAPGVLLKAEAIVPVEQVMPYFGEGDRRGRECQLAYHSGLMASAWAALAEGDAALPRRLLAGTPATPPGTGWITYVRCHDDIVWSVLRPLVESAGEDFHDRIGRAAAFLEGRVPGSFARGAAFQAGDDDAIHGSNGMAAALFGLPIDPYVAPDPAALRRFVLMHALALWVGAVPLLYMGDELGQGNNADPADRERIAADGRWLQRPHLSTVAMEALEQQRGVPASTFAALRALVAARRRPGFPARDAVQVIDAGHPGLLALRRGPDALALFHFGREPVAVDLAALGLPADVRGTISSGVDDAGDVRTLAPWATLWVMPERESRDA